MTGSTDDDESIDYGRRISSSLEEIGRHVADETNTEVQNPWRLAKRYLIVEYCREHSEVFTKNGQLDYVYTGTQPKGTVPPAYDEDEEEPADEEKIQFPNDEAPKTDL